MKYLFFIFLLGQTLNSFSQQNQQTMVIIKTEYGNIKIRLYDETPKHRDNFIKLVNEKFFDGLLFHRVIKDFMIQGGDPTSRNAGPNTQLGSGGPSYTIPAEFNPKFFHKKGALAAARQADQVNPTKASSGSQFYIVQGKKYSTQELLSMQQQINDNAKNQKFMQYIQKPEKNALRKTLDSLQKAGNIKELNRIIEEIDKEIAKEITLLQFSEEQLREYSTNGGTPFLDGNYTVFGEVIEGLDVIDKIAAVQTKPGDRPITDLKMTIEIVK